MTNTNTIEDQQRIATEVLELLRPLATGVVAGGAPRDWYLGTPARDIDIFLEHTDSGDFGGVILRSQVMMEMEGAGWVSINTNNYPYKGSSHIRSISSFLKDGQKVQVMILSRWIPAKFVVVRQFPVSISKISWTPEGGYVISRDFALSVEKKILLVGGGSGFAPEKYIQKIIKRFPDYTVIRGGQFDG